MDKAQYSEHTKRSRERRCLKDKDFCHMQQVTTQPWLVCKEHTCLSDQTSAFMVRSLWPMHLFPYVEACCSLDSFLGSKVRVTYGSACFHIWNYASALLEQNVPFRPHSLRPFWRLAQWFELQWTHKASVLGETQTSVTQCFISFRCLILQACSQDNECMFPVDVLVIVSHMYGSSWIISILNS